MSKDKKSAKEVLGIAHMAKHLGVAPASARDKLRRAGIGAEGGKYEWPSKKAMEADAAKLKPAAKAVKAAPAKKAVTKSPATKPAAKSKDKAAA